MNLEQQKSLYKLLDASVKMHFMLLKLAEAPTEGHSSIPNSKGDDVPCEYCGIINLAEYSLSELYADFVHERFITPAPLLAKGESSSQVEKVMPATPAPLDVERLAIQAAARMEQELSQVRTELTACTEAYDAAAAPGGVHTHGPDEGQGTTCSEYLVGACRFTATPAPLDVERDWRGAPGRCICGATPAPLDGCDEFCASRGHYANCPNATPVPPAWSIEAMKAAYNPETP
jgi:hypothetical protein